MELGTTLPVEVGDTIAGKYRVDAVIGAGGMGIVLAATHVELERKVAVKLIRPELTEDPAIVERLMLEARAAAGIRSEHVGSVLDVGRLEGGAPYIVMEFLEGTEFAALLAARGRLPIIETVDLVLQVCEALAHAHKKHIVHRDLKPENLFVVTSPDGRQTVKVLDFGIAKQLGDASGRALTNPATAVGSPQYMAPEQMQASDIDVRVDIWALGAILYEAFAGARAFEGESVPVICAKVLSQDPEPLQSAAPQVPDTLANIIHRCLNKDRQARFADVAELASALAPYGSSLAQTYVPRIRGVLGYTGTSPVLNDPARGVGYDGTVLGSHVPGTSAATAVGLGGTAPGVVGAVPNIAPGATTRGVTLDGESPATTAHPKKKKAPLWPVWAGAGFAVLAASSIWVFSQKWLEQERTEREAAQAAARDSDNAVRDNNPTARDSDNAARDNNPTARDNNNAVRDSDDAVRDTAAPSASERGAGSRPPSASVGAGIDAGAASPPARTPPRGQAPSPRPAPRPAPAPAITPPRPRGQSDGSDPWDPDNFGGRH